MKSSFHIQYEVKQPDMSDLEGKGGRSNVSRITFCTLRGYRRFPSMQELHHDVKRISEQEYESLKVKFPKLAVEGKARVSKLGDYMGAILSVAGWEGSGKKLSEWEQEFHPILAKVETPDRVSFFAGFQVDCD